MVHCFWNSARTGYKKVHIPAIFLNLHQLNPLQSFNPERRHAGRLRVFSPPQSFFVIFSKCLLSLVLHPDASLEQNVKAILPGTAHSHRRQAATRGVSTYQYSSAAFYVELCAQARKLRHDKIPQPSGRGIFCGSFAFVSHFFVKTSKNNLKKFTPRGLKTAWTNPTLV